MISFFSSSDMQTFHHLLGCRAISINSSLIIFLSSLRFSNLTCLRKKLSRLDWKFKKCALKKVYLNSYWDNCFFITNFDNQKLFHHIHCFQYIFCHQDMTMKFCGFHIFIFYGLYFEFYSLSVLYIFIIQQNVFTFYITYCYNSIAYIVATILLHFIFIPTFYFFMFTFTFV